MDISRADNGLKVLLVEDNPGDAKLVTALLSGPDEIGFEVHHAKRLDEAATLLSKQSFDAVLLDLSLPDSNGMHSIDATKSQIEGQRIPIVVITGHNADDQDLQSVQHGAEDYLLKSNLHAEVLSRSIRYAVERQRLKQRQDVADAEKRQAREIENLEKMGSPSATMITARVYGLERLSDSAADTFEALVEQYSDLIDQAIEQRAFKIDSRTSQGVRILAQRLGFLRASPRDVVELHVKSLKANRRAQKTTSYAIAEEARFLLLELMGNLAAYYRDHMLPIGKARRPSGIKSELDQA